ncbi:MAG: hypothetical protein M3O22_06185 [Pseudomonadota bacterium]|nr:hypothetical protein [Pseudomonadota bacterium]
MADPRRIDVYHIAENDSGKILIAIQDLEADGKDAVYSLTGPDLTIRYGDGRVCMLPGIPVSTHPVLKTGKAILLVETGSEGLVRAYDVKNESPVARKRGPL